METKVKDNGQAKVANTVSADKKPQFVAGNPVNVVSKAEQAKEEPKKMLKNRRHSNSLNSRKERLPKQKLRQNL